LFLLLFGLFYCMWWQTSRFRIDVSHAKVMGIVNLTPDSFSDGGHQASVHAQIKHAQRLVQDGADLLDLGAESTRPGAVPVPLADELARLLPVLQELVRWNIPISVDTYKPDVMRAALDAGADIINDVWALRQPGARQVVAQHPRCGVCLMHMHLEPSSMQSAPMSGDPWAHVIQFLEQQIQLNQAVGIKKDRIFIDPGIGFGKTPEHNLALLAHQERVLALGHGVLVGWSRKSTLGVLLGDGGAMAPAADLAKTRLVPSVVAALLAVQRGAHVVRVHDVRETVQALRVWTAAS
jgi:dihydropteroate synthase